MRATGTSLKCTSQLIRRPNLATVFANTVWKNTFPIVMGRMTVMSQKVITRIEIRLNAQNGATASVPTLRTLRTRDGIISIQMCNILQDPTV